MFAWGMHIQQRLRLRRVGKQESCFCSTHTFLASLSGSALLLLPPQAAATKLLVVISVR